MPFNKLKSIDAQKQPQPPRVPSPLLGATGPGRLTPVPAPAAPQDGLGPGAAPRIMWGDADTSQQYFPFTVYVQWDLRNGNASVCTGSVLSSTTILTAAHVSVWVGHALFVGFLNGCGMGVERGATAWLGTGALIAPWAQARA